MFNIKEIKELIQAVDESDISKLEVKGENKEGIVIQKESQNDNQPVVVERPQVSIPQQSQGGVTSGAVNGGQESAVNTGEASAEANASQTEDPFEEITSPMVGTFYRAPSPDDEPYVQVGSQIKQDTIVGIVEAMKLMNELEAEIEGEIVEILVENGELVEYGQPLFRVK